MQRTEYNVMILELFLSFRPLMTKQTIKLTFALFPQPAVVTLRFGLF